MTWKDTLEIGLKENAAYRKDNLPASEVSGPEVSQGPGRSAEIPEARAEGTRAQPPAVRGASRAPQPSRRGSRRGRAPGGTAT